MAANQKNSRRIAMNTTVISYSLTGNNDALAASIASELSAQHIRVTESTPRKMGKIAFDMLLNRKPKVSPTSYSVGEHDFVIFVGPVWMGQVASPLRACLKSLKPKLNHYAFVSISGGADGPNPKLTDELTKRVGKQPATVIDLHIANLLPPDPKPTRDDTSAYRVTGGDVKSLTTQAVNALQDVMAA
jgi:multimeric flavodoxin WrbA